MDIDHSEEPENHDDHEEPYHQQVQHQSLSARLPESLGEGVFTTSSLIVESGDMFLIDFVSGAAPPVRLVARVVVTPTTMKQFLGALNQSCEKARSARRQDRGEEGQAAQAPGSGTETVGAGVGAGGKPGGGSASHRNVEDIYSELKFTDDRLCGAFANTVIIRHSADEVVFDFISNYFPRAVVTCRVVMATSRVERFRRSVEDAYRKFEEKHRGF